MDRYLSSEHIELQELVAGFARDEIDPVARHLDHAGEFPWETVARMANLGLLGVPVPEELGGLGRDYLSYVLVVEELAKHDATHAITVSAHTTLGTSPILSFGSARQRERWVRPLARGAVLGGFGLTEAGAGSDAAGTRTRAEKVEGGYRLNGAKAFITHAGVGEIFNVTAVTDPTKGSRGITSFVVTKPTCDLERSREVGVGHSDELEFVDGVSAGAKEEKMGWRASDTRELLLEDAFVPEENRLGAEGEGFSNFMETLQAGRIGIAALSLGLAQGALDLVLRHDGVRKRLAGEMSESQLTRFRLADMATEIEAGRHLTYHAAWLKDRRLPFGKAASMAKLYCSEMATRATLAAMRVLGPDGYTDEYAAERMMRDAKACEIGEGTNEIQRLVIGRLMLEETLGGAT